MTICTATLQPPLGGFFLRGRKFFLTICCIVVRYSYRSTTTKENDMIIMTAKGLIEAATSQTSTIEDAQKALQSAENNVQRGYFPAGHANEAAFIRAKYPSL